MAEGITGHDLLIMMRDVIGYQLHPQEETRARLDGHLTRIEEVLAKTESNLPPVKPS